MSQKLTVAQQEKQILDQQVRQKMDQLQETLREAKRANGLDPDEDLVQDWELETTTLDYLPHEWKQPEETPEATDLLAPWETWVREYMEEERHTILDWVTQVREVRDWWIPHLALHRLVAAKLIVMDQRSDPEAVTIETREWKPLNRAEQFDQLLKLDRVVREVKAHQNNPRPVSLMESLERFAQRTQWTQFLEALEEHRQNQ